MIRFLIKKTVVLFILLLLASIAVFSILYVLPGDPAQIILGMNASAETLANLRAELGLDQPFLIQYWDWIGGLITGKSSVSINYNVPVFDLIASCLGVTIPLAIMAILFAVIISIPLGIYAAKNHNKPGDVTVMAISQLGLATPEFWLGILFMLFFAVKLGWFSAGGFPGWENSFWGSLKALFLPALALGLIRASILTRLTRSSILDVLREDYIRTAKAKGLTGRTIIYLHTLKNAIIPVLTIMGLQLGQLMAGAIIIENVYYLPGLGRLVFQAIGQRDLPVVRDVVLFMAAAVILINFLVDVAYVYIDPRLRAKNSSV